jgi:outer membrane lipoprotein
MHSRGCSAFMTHVLASVCLLAVYGCSSYKVIPEHLKGKVNRDVSFSAIQHSPSQYKGQLVALGGEVLDVKRLEDKTRIEVLVQPLSDELVPMPDKSRSGGGRFYAFDTGKELIDPAVLEKGTPITVVGEVTGSTEDRLDQSTYNYPNVWIRDLTKWEKMDAPRFPYRYPYYGGHYWRPWGLYAYPYYPH